MVKFRHLLAALVICATLVTVCALAQSTFTQIRDTVINPNGTLFNGTVVITWNGYTAPGGTPVSQLSASARIYNGALSVLLVPTTTATAGTYYSVVYSSSDGTVTWTETWQVPPSTTALTIAAVRQSTTEGSGTSTGTGTSSGSGYATLPIAISQVTSLSSDLSTINASIATLTSQVSALGAVSLTSLTNTVNSLSTTVSGLSTSVSGLTTTVNGNSTSITTLTNSLATLGTTVSGNGTSITSLTNSVGTLGTTVTGNTNSISTLTNTVNGVNTTVSGLSASITSLNNQVASLQTTLNNLTSGSVTASFADAETPGGTINGTTTAFTLANPPTPTGSLALYRNGLLQSPGVDFTLAGTSVTFTTASIPQTGDILEAYYRVAGTGPAATLVDSEVPGGTINGTNLAFTLVNAPNPVAGLKLYKNGLLMSQPGDYSVSGSTITFVSAAVPVTGDTLVASYRH
jgi:uncharacterized protein YoxC